MRKNLLAIAMILFGICIVISSLNISNALEKIAYNQHLASSSLNVEQNEWELIAVDETHIILLNQRTGEHYTRFVTDEDWSTEWKRFALP